MNGTKQTEAKCCVCGVIFCLKCGGPVTEGKHEHERPGDLRPYEDPAKIPCLRCLLDMVVP